MPSAENFREANFDSLCEILHFSSAKNEKRIRDALLRFLDFTLKLHYIIRQYYLISRHASWLPFAVSISLQKYFLDNRHLSLDYPQLYLSINYSPLRLSLDYPPLSPIYGGKMSGGIHQGIPCVYIKP